MSQLAEVPRLFWTLLQFCDPSTLASAAQVCRRWNLLFCHDTFWEKMFIQFNLQAVLCNIPAAFTQGGNSSPASRRKTLSSPSRRLTAGGEDDVLCGTSRLFRYFIDEVVSGAFLRGCFSFEGDAGLEYAVSSLTMLVTPAQLGSCRSISKVRLNLQYRAGDEEWNGAIRFSAVRKCFVMCFSPLNIRIRGPCYAVVVAVAQRKWANQSNEQFAKHKGGLRLILTPISVQGTARFSEVTETDVLSVSRPPPRGAAPGGGSPSLSPRAGFT